MCQVWNRFGDIYKKGELLAIVTFCSCLLAPQREMLRFNCTSAICTTPKRAQAFITLLLLATLLYHISIDFIQKKDHFSNATSLHSNQWNKHKSYDLNICFFYFLARFCARKYNKYKYSSIDILFIKSHLTNLAFSKNDYNAKTATIKYVAVSFLLVPIIGT